MDNPPQNWEAFALLLIDVQNDFWEDSKFHDFPDFPENISQLLKFCRGVGIEVVHIRSSFQADESDWMARYRLRHIIPCIASTPGVEVLPFAQDIAGEKVIVKHTFDAFLAPELYPYLRGAKKRFLLTAGLITTTCVLLTTAGAMQRGFLTAVVEDCCADDPSRHEFTLSTYPYIFDRVKWALLPSHYEQWMTNLTLLESK